MASKTLVTGCLGQIGRILVPALVQRGIPVIATDIELPPARFPCPFHRLDITDPSAIARLVKFHKVNRIVHFASLLASAAEKDLPTTFSVNFRGLENILDVARTSGCRVFNASSLAAYGDGIESAKEDDRMLPDSIYGVGKVYGELLGRYYHTHFGVDYRSLRFPIIVSPDDRTKRWTTLFARKIFCAAVTKGKYECYLRADTRLPIIHVNDCVAATVSYIG